MTMTEQEATSLKAIDLCRRINRQAADQYAARGISPEDIALAALYSAVDVVEVVKGPGMAAIEWLRTGLDVIEAQLLARETRQ